MTLTAPSDSMPETPMRRRPKHFCLWKANCRNSLLSHWLAHPERGIDRRIARPDADAPTAGRREAVDSSRDPVSRLPTCAIARLIRRCSTKWLRRKAIKFSSKPDLSNFISYGYTFLEVDFASTNQTVGVVGLP